MATQQEYSYVANALVAFAHQWISQLSPWQQAMIPMDKIPAAAGATSKCAVDALDQYRMAHQQASQPAPTPAPAPTLMLAKNGRRKRK